MRVSFKTKRLSLKQHYFLSSVFIHKNEEGEIETRDNCNLISTKGALYFILHFAKLIRSQNVIINIHAIYQTYKP